MQGNKNTTEYDVIIIGAGASGLMAAVYAARNGKKVAVLERNNEPAKKIYATGNGRCNYLNQNADDFEDLYSALANIGIAGILDEGGRLYPRSREAKSVVSALLNGARAADIICDCHVSDIQKLDGAFRVITKDGRKYLAKKLIIAVGGKAGIQFGCYGEGYRWAQFMGHKLVKPVPALVAMESTEDISSLHGVRTLAKASILCNGAVLASDDGEVQFTKDSISGICVMNLSRFVRLEGGKTFTLSLDLFPDIEVSGLEDLLQNQRNVCGSELDGLLPEKLKIFIQGRLEKIADPKQTAVLLKNICFDIKGTKGWADAQVTSGGIPLEEIDLTTMESKLVPGLYFTGEIIDYDGPCGGYNLANAWKTGMLAGKAAAHKE